MKKSHKIIVAVTIAVVTVVMAAVMIAVYFSVVVPKRTKGEKIVTLQITYTVPGEYTNRTFSDIKTSTETVYQLLVEQNEPLNLRFKCDMSSLGAYLTSINGVDNDDDKGYYYFFMINGTDSMVGISDAAIKSGDVITIEYRSF